MTRHRLSLDGSWQFRVDTDAPDTWRTITVPGAWQAQFADLAEKPGAAIYERTFNVPANWKDRAAILHFGAVDYWAEVWVNDQRVGDHEGGYLPFEFDVSANLHPRAINTVRVRVVDPGDAPPDGLPMFSEVPHGKQSWYGAMGGLWQGVWLERRARVHIQAMALKVKPEASQVSASLPLSAAAAAGQRVVVTVRDAGGAVVAEFDRAVGGGRAGC